MLTRYGKPDGVTLPKDARCITYDPVSGEYVGRRKPWPGADEARVDIVDGNKLLVVIEQARPTAGVDYDPETHKAERSIVADVVNEERRTEWTILPLSTAELEVANSEKLHLTERDGVRSMVRALRRGTGNVDARLTRLERAVALLLRERGIE